MLIGSELKEIKYVAVEVLRNKAVTAADVECGLYMGIVAKPDKDNVERKFLTLMVSSVAVRLYNLDEYDILTVDVMDKDARYMTIFNNSDSDQVAAAVLLKEITKNLEEDKRLYINDPQRQLIDVDTYEDYPETILNSDNITGDVTKSSSSSTGGTTKTTGGSAGSTNNTTTGSTYDYTSTVKEEPKVTKISRKGKLPATDRLEKMREKVKMLAEADVQEIKLPIPECDREEENDDDKKTSATTV